jgi:polyphosphate kinase
MQYGMHGCCQSSHFGAQFYSSSSALINLIYDCYFTYSAVLVELKARFDEARNVGFAERLEEAGCNVAYGIVGLKTHAKCMLVVRREKSAVCFQLAVDSR